MSHPSLQTLIAETPAVAGGKQQTGNDEVISLTIFDGAYNIIGGGNDGDKKHVKTKEEADHSLPYMIAVPCSMGQ